MIKVNNQLKLMKAEKFCLIAINPVTEKSIKLFNITPNGEKNYDLSFSELKKVLKLARGYNNQSNIYIKHAPDSAFWSVVIDDVSPEKLPIIKELAEPDYIIESSENNYQAVLLIPKAEITKEQANFLVAELNKNYGDKNFSGENHWHRLITFKNKKPGRNDFEIRLIETEKSDGENRKKLIAEVLKNYNPSEKREFFHSEISEEKLSDEEFSQMKEIAETTERKYIKFVNHKNLKFNYSSVDYWICCHAIEKLRKEFSDPSIITNKIYSFFIQSDYNDVSSRHKNLNDYLSRTIRKAFEYLKSSDKKTTPRACP